MVLSMVSQSLNPPVFLGCRRTKFSLFCMLGSSPPGPSIILCSSVLAPQCSQALSPTLCLSVSFCVSVFLSPCPHPMPTVLRTASCWPGPSSVLLKCYHCAPKKPSHLPSPREVCLSRKLLPMRRCFLGRRESPATPWGTAEEVTRGLPHEASQHHTCWPGMCSLAIRATGPFSCLRFV